MKRVFSYNEVLWMKAHRLLVLILLAVCPVVLGNTGAAVDLVVFDIDGIGGEALLLVPSLNAEPAWIDTVAGWIREA